MSPLIIIVVFVESGFVSPRLQTYICISLLCNVIAYHKGDRKKCHELSFLLSLLLLLFHFLFNTNAIRAIKQRSFNKLVIDIQALIPVYTYFVCFKNKSQKPQGNARCNRDNTFKTFAQFPLIYIKLLSSSRFYFFFFNQNYFYGRVMLQKS